MEHISELSDIILLLRAKFVVAEIEDFELLELLELVLESGEPIHAEPVAREVQVLESVKVKHVLEIETEFVLNAVVGKA